MQADSFSGLGDVVVVLLERPLDELLFKLRDGFAKQDTSINHLSNQVFQPVFHLGGGFGRIAHDFGPEFIGDIKAIAGR